MQEYISKVCLRSKESVDFCQYELWHLPEQGETKWCDFWHFTERPSPLRDQGLLIHRVAWCAPRQNKTQHPTPVRYPFSSSMGILNSHVGTLSLHTCLQAHGTLLRDSEGIICRNLPKSHVCRVALHCTREPKAHYLVHQLDSRKNH